MSNLPHVTKTGNAILALLGKRGDVVNPGYHFLEAATRKLFQDRGKKWWIELEEASGLESCHEAFD